MVTARWEFGLPDIGEGGAGGETGAGRVKPGDAVREDQPIIELMTDKATVTITAPRVGTVVETRGRLGETIAVHSVLVVFETEGEGAPAPDVAVGQTNGHAAPSDGGHPEGLGETDPGRGATLATPATRRHARELDVDLRSVAGTGPLGRVTRRDVEVYAKARGGPAQPPPPGHPDTPGPEAP